MARTTAPGCTSVRTAHISQVFIYLSYDSWLAVHFVCPRGWLFTPEPDIQEDEIVFTDAWVCCVEASFRVLYVTACGQAIRDQVHPRACIPDTLGTLGLWTMSLAVLLFSRCYGSPVLRRRHLFSLRVVKSLPEDDEVV